MAGGLPHSFYNPTFNLLGLSHVEFVQEIYPFPEKAERCAYAQPEWLF